MNELINGRMIEWMNEWNKEKISEWMHKWFNCWMNQITVNEWMNTCMDN